MSGTEKPGRPSGSSHPANGSPAGISDPNIPASASHNHQIFKLAHGKKGKEGAIEHLNDQEPIRFGHLFKRPVIRQWLYQGKLYREEDQRVCSRFELFFDLLFVGLIHQLADGLSESDEPSLMLILRFVLLFYLSFSVWQDVRHWINQSGTDDVIQRLYILIVMVLLVGFHANAVGIEILPTSEGIVESDQGHASDEASGVEGGEFDEPVTSAEQVGRRFLAHTARHMLRRSGGGKESEREEPILVQPIGDTGYWFAEGYHHAIAAAIGFYLVCKLLKLALLFVYGLLLPKFRKALWLEMIPTLLLACIYVPLTLLFDPVLVIILLAAGIGLDILSKYAISLLLQKVHGRTKRSGKSSFIPAQSVEHLAERTVLFVVLVLGESILNSTFKATETNFGVSPQWGRSALCVACAFFLVWIYFDADSSRVFAHALRRNPFTAITFNLMHFPLCASLILVSSTLPRLIGEKQSVHGFRWFYGGSMAVAMASIALIGLLHKNLDRAGSALWPHSARIGLRFCVALGFATLPIKSDWSNASFLGCYCGLLVVLVVSETLGKLGVVGRRFDEAKAAEYYRMLEETSGKRRGSGGGGGGSDGALADVEERYARDYELHGLGGGANDAAAGNGAAGRGRERRHSMMQSLSTSAVNIFESTHRTLNPYTSGVKLSRRSSWHPYDDLMPDEKGDEDVGVEGELGHMNVRERLSKAERWALVAN